MMLADFIIYGIVLGWITRGRLGNLTQVDIPFFWLIGVGFVLRYLALVPLVGDILWFTPLGMVAVFIGTIYSYRVPGMLCIAGGTLLNLLVMTANRGRMPVAVPLDRHLGLDSLIQRLEAGQFPDHTILTPLTPLSFLSDVIPYFSLLFFQPFVVSIGDYLLGFGIIWFLIWAMKKRERKDRVTH